jgi:ATP-binding cassette subfamily B protein
MSAGSPAEEKKARNMSSRLEGIRTTFRNVVRAFKLVWQAHPQATVALIIVTLLFALLPAAQAWVAKLIVDTIVNAINTKMSANDGFMAVLPYLLLEFGLFAATITLQNIRNLLDHIINARLTHSVQTSIINKALGLDMHFFENSSYYDKLYNAWREANWRPFNIVNSTFLMVQDSITLLSMLALLLAFGPIVALLLFGTAMPAFFVQMKYSRLYFSLLTWEAPEFRRRAYLETLLTQNDTAKEIKLFGLGLPLLKRYQDIFWSFYNKDARLAIRRTFAGTLWGMVGTAGYYGAYAYVVFRTLEGSITLGDLTLYLTVLRQGQGTFTGLFHSIGGIYEGSIFLSNLFGFFKMEANVEKSREEARPVPHPIRQGIEFRNVSFRYPDRDDWVLRNINLRINASEKLALVGANGAGKTTLVKLLTRLYEPSEGQILLDGIDLREYDLHDLRERIGVIFQDFVRYQATARENIGFGRIEYLDDRERIENAARRGGADEVVEELPEGYDTMLGKFFDKGQELSGGQWQKMALGRAFMRDGEVLVLDEPTSALDAEKEYEIFQRFRDLTEGKIALLISHRFSTVRMADRIAVLEDGSLIELGTHPELLEKDGTYARLFNMQAEGYR